MKPFLTFMIFCTLPFNSRTSQTGTANIMKLQIIASVILVSLLLRGSHAADAPAGAWNIGTPIVTYCLGPGLSGGPAMDAAREAYMKRHGQSAPSSR